MRIPYVVLSMVLILLACSAASHATTVKRLSEEDLINEADRIVKVVLKEPGKSAWDSGHQRIYTTYSFEVREDLAGTGEKYLDLLQPGGEVDGIGQRAEGVPTFNLGDHVVLFLRKTDVGYQVIGLTQGVFESRNDGGVEKFIQRLEGLHLMGGNQTPLQIDRVHLEQQIKTVWTKKKLR